MECHQSKKERCVTFSYSSLYATLRCVIKIVTIVGQSYSIVLNPVSDEYTLHKAPLMDVC